MQGKAIVYQRDHINTDEIIPARYLNTDKEKELALHAMEDLDTKFLDKVEPGSWIVAGQDFGCGSSREHAVWALRGAGVQGVIASSFARIFFRNSINNGFPAIMIDKIADKVKTGQMLKVDLKKGLVKNLTTDEKYQFLPYSDFIREIIDAEGLMNYITQEEI
ncbi:MAG TPA: 3-isopropylmalate dehydratase small subunit [bacterium]|nr:3-isopropylmalate dehydratase small subunit [bacterium]